MLWISLLAVVVATGSAIIGYSVFRSQIDPEVIVYTCPDQRRISILLLVIENIGRGGASNIRFETSKPLPKRAFGLDDKSVRPFEPMNDGPLISGMPFLEPGGKRVLTWGQFAGLKKHLGDDVSVISVEYEHRHFGWPFRIRKQGQFPIEVFSFETTDASDLNYDKHAADHLKDIAGSLKKILQIVQRS